MNLKLTIDHTLKGDGYFLGLTGENNSEVLSIDVEDERLHSKWAYIEFQNNDSEMFSTERLTIEEGVINYPIVSGLLKEGHVNVQVVFRDESGVVWKSFVRKFTVGESLCVSDKLPVENPDFITEAQKLLDSCESARDSINETSEDLTSRVETCEKTCKEISEGESERVANEEARQTNETARKSSETKRNNNETTRISNEETRQSNEETRIANETERQTNEATRQENERLRVEAENSRIEFLKSELVIRDKLLENMEIANEGKAYNNVIDDSIAYQKSNPSNVLPYAKINSVGGMTYKSENLLVLEDMEETVVNGITYSVKNGIVNASGTIQESTFRALVSNIENCLVKGKTYTIWSNLKSELYLEIRLTDGEGINYFYNTKTTTSSKFTYSEDIASVSILIVSSNVSGSDITGTYKFMIVEGEVAPTEFKQGYEGFRHTPISNIRSVGKNLFDISKLGLVEGENNISISKVASNSITITSKEDYEGNGYIRSRKTLKELAPSLVIGKTYTLSATTNSSQNLIYLTNSNGVIYFNNSFVLDEKMLSSQVAFYGLNQGYGDGTGDCVISNIQIEEGEVATEYEPYIEHNLTIPSEVQELEGYGLGVNDTYHNYIDLKNRKYVQRVGIVDLGTLNWNYQEINQRFYTYGLSGVLKGVSSEKVGNAICEKYTLTSLGKISNSSLGTNDKMFALFTNEEYNYIYIRDLDYTNPSELKTALSGVYLIYELATPIETDISMNDYLLEVEESGTITFENEYKQDAPSNITYQVKC